MIYVNTNTARGLSTNMWKATTWTIEDYVGDPVHTHEVILQCVNQQKYTIPIDLQESMP